MNDAEPSDSLPTASRDQGPSTYDDRRVNDAVAMSQAVARMLTDLLVNGCRLNFDPTTGSIWLAEQGNRR